ncbi:MAG TPA: lyase [Dehalococcoidia bacterium]|nr:lyase [Dehalococcoidia bacterium]
MKRLLLCALAAALASPVPAAAQGSGTVDLKEWPVEWGGRPRDPAVAPDGKVWFVGQAGNYIASFDPKTEQFKRYEIEEGTNPHNLIVDPKGIVWYAGNRNGRIGRLDPQRGVLTVIMTGEAKDPHTLIYDPNGYIWFTSQGSNRIGRLTIATEKVDLITPHDQPSNPYGIVLDPQGHPWVALFRTNTLVRIDPKTLALTRYKQATEESRSRRIEVTPDGMAWYVDEPRGYLGRINPKTGEVKEWLMPGGAGSRPYALTKDDEGRLWISETGPVKQLVGFDPKTERFVSVNKVSGNIRHMFFHQPTGAMWFGTDAGNIGRLITRTIR